MLIVALTGNIASGKSTVAASLAARGATLIDSDAAARAAVAPGSAALGAIVTHFGQGILLADGALDRAALGRHVFANADARRALESIVHPAIEEARLLREGDALCVLRKLVAHHFTITCLSSV